MLMVNKMSDGEYVDGFFFLIVIQSAWHYFIHFLTRNLLFFSWVRISMLELNFPFYT